MRVMDYFIKLIKKKYGKDISVDAKAMQKLRREAEKAKRSLSNQHQVRVEVEALFDGIDLSEPLTRARFEELNIDLFRKTLGPVKKAMEDASFAKARCAGLPCLDRASLPPRRSALCVERSIPPFRCCEAPRSLLPEPLRLAPMLVWCRCVCSLSPDPLWIRSDLAVQETTLKAALRADAPLVSLCPVRPSADGHR